VGQRRNNNESITTMTNKIIYASLHATLQLAHAMCRAGERAVFAPSQLEARFWESVRASGEALEAAVDLLAVRWGIDISRHMIDCAYGWE
jgi:hypothetical protein